MVHVEVVSAISFGEILVCTAKVPLATSSAAVIAGRRDGEHSTHGQDPAANVLPVEVAAEADLLHLDFVGAKDFSRTAKGIIFGVIEVDNVSRYRIGFPG